MRRPAVAASYAGADVILTQTATGVASRLRNIQTYQFADGAAALSDLPRTTWTGPAGGHFGIGANWSNGQVPTGTSEVRINAGASVVVTQQERNVVDSLVVASGADIDVTSGQFIVNDAAAGTTNDGTIEAETGITLILAGGLVNAGAITLYGGTLQTNSPNVTLSGSGTVVMQGGAIGGRDASGSPLAYDTFFIDGRGAGVSWGTVVNFHHGDAVTIFGFKDGVSTRPWTAVDGVNGFQGATIHSELGGAGTGVNASVTFAGVSLADAQSKFSVLTGTIGADPYLYIAHTG